MGMAQNADTVRGGLLELDLEDLEGDESLRACAFAALGQPTSGYELGVAFSTMILASKLSLHPLCRT